MQKIPKTTKIKLTLSKKELHKLNRVRRWETESESVVLELGPKRSQL